MIHQLKLVGADLADAVLAGDKTYEIRVDDRKYSVGDMLYQTLYDSEKDIYLRHDVSSYMYIVSYLSRMSEEDGGYVVMGIHKACPSKYVVRALLLRFCKEGTVCNLIMFDGTKREVIVEDLTGPVIEISISGKRDTVNANDIVWATPTYGAESLNRSITYESIKLSEIIWQNDFVNDHTYGLFIKRVNGCEPNAYDRNI